MSINGVKRSNSLKSEKGKLGMSVKISPKSAVTIDPEGFSMDFIGPHITVLIEIGDETGYLVLSGEAWKKLKAGIKIETETVSEVKSKMK